jgi:hypothetical protein
VQAAEATQVQPAQGKLTYTSPNEDGQAEIHEGSTAAPAKQPKKDDDGKNKPGSSFFRS